MDTWTILTLVLQKPGSCGESQLVSNLSFLFFLSSFLGRGTPRKGLGMGGRGRTIEHDRRALRHLAYIARLLLELAYGSLLGRLAFVN